MDFLRINLHNHTTFSDGRQAPREIVERAIENKIDVVAITDHYEYFLGFLNRKSNIKLYFKVMSHLKEVYGKRINIITGLEMDCQIINEADLPMEFLDQLDLILFERVWDMKDLDAVIKLKPKLSPVIVGLAHPELEGFTDFDKLVDKLEKNNIFVELNTAAYEYSGNFDPNKGPPLMFETQEAFFRLLKNRNVQISIGSDNHRPEDSLSDVDEGYKFIRKLGLEDNLIKI